MKWNHYIALLLLFSSCQTDFLDLDQLGPYRNKIVVNGVLATDEGVRLQISSSSSSVSTELPQLLTNADVTLSRNGNVETVQYDAGSKSYTAAVSPNEGELYQVEVRAPGFLTVNSSVQIPISIGTQSTLIPNGGVDTSGLQSDLLQVSFTDDASEHNYYKVNFYYYNTTLGEFIPMAFALNDPDFTEYNSISLNDASLLFTDELFNGESKTLSTVAPYGLVLGNPGDKYLIQLESITEDLYRYYITLQRAVDAKEANFSNPFNNAVVIHSNVNRGLGIVGGSYVSMDTLR